MMMSKMLASLRRSPLVPSMLTYSVLYPGANFVQQVFQRRRGGGREKSRLGGGFQVYDLWRLVSLPHCLQLAQTRQPTLPAADTQTYICKGSDGSNLLCSCRPHLV